MNCPCVCPETRRERSFVLYDDFLVKDFYLFVGSEEISKMKFSLLHMLNKSSATELNPQLALL